MDQYSEMKVSKGWGDPGPDFPVEEYDERYTRAREMMEKAKMDALMVTEVTNYIYFGGHRIPYMKMQKTRPFVLILPLKRDPVIIAQSGYKKAIENSSWIKDIRCWSGLPFEIDIVKDTIQDLGLAEAKIGAEMGLEQAMNISPNDFLFLTKVFPRARFIDASEIFWNLRYVKSLREIECLKKSASITAKAFQKLFKALGKGVREVDIVKMVNEYIMDLGEAPPEQVYPKIWPGGILTDGPTNRALEKEADFIYIDIHSVVKNYHTDYCRLAVLGKPTDEQRFRYDQIVEVNRKVLEKIKPGIKTSDISSFTNVELEKAGLAPKLAGRVGHGLGLIPNELPSLGPNDQTTIKPGMVLTMEPGNLFDFGYFVVEDNYVVTENSIEIISNYPKIFHEV